MQAAELKRRFTRRRYRKARFIYGMYLHGKTFYCGAG